MVKVTSHNKIASLSNRYIMEFTEDRTLTCYLSKVKIFVIK